MPNDLVVHPSVAAGPEPASVSAVRIATSAPEAAEPADVLPNPILRLDPVLGLVVIEFHNAAGGVTNSFPDARQLNAYRTARGLDNGPDIGQHAADRVHSPATRTV